MHGALETIHGGTCAWAAPAVPPRLPMSVLKEIALDAAAMEDEPRRAAVRLARTCRAWFVRLWGHYLLPDIVLRGEDALRHFCFSVTKNVLGLGMLVARHTHTISVLQDTKGRNAALFDGVTHTKLFGTQTAPLLRMVLRRCTSLTSLRIECEPLALDTRDGAGGLGAARASLQELVCLQSPWAGDAVDAVWHAGEPPAPWDALTHLQLYGPRSRLSVHTAAALGALPRLSHLALIMPSFVDARGGKCPAPVLQAIVDACAHLEHLLLVGHDEEHWVGATRHLRPAVAALRVGSAGRVLRVALVTATAPAQPWEPTRRAHPGVYTDWMLARALDGRHWDFSGLCDDMAYTVDETLVPYEARNVHADADAPPSPSPSPRSSPRSPPLFWHEARTSPSPPSPEVWGIDNLA